MKRNAREETDRGGVDARASWGAAVLRPYMIWAEIDFGDLKALGREKRRACECTKVWLIVVTGGTPHIFSKSVEPAESGRVANLRKAGVRKGRWCNGLRQHSFDTVVRQGGDRRGGQFETGAVYTRQCSTG